MATYTEEPQSKPQGAFTLGLDVGSNSLGWAIIADEPQQNGSRILRTGVRVFPAGTRMEKMTETSSMGERRVARGMRRQIDRRSRRRKKLIHVLRQYGIIRSTGEEFVELIRTEPMALRARGLDEKLTLEEFGRALIHLNHSRGFKSNRRVDKSSSDSGTVKKSIKELREKMAEKSSRTLGEYLHTQFPLNSSRRRGSYLSREMVIDEFEKLWEAQIKHYPDVLTAKAHDDAYEAIFFQRPFDKNTADKVGYCSLEKQERRERRGHPMYHHYRILTELDNVRLTSSHELDAKLVKPDGGLTVKGREVLADQLELKDKLTITQIKKLLDLPENVEINLAKGKREYLQGNTSTKTLHKAFGKRVWNELSETQQLEICRVLLEEDDDVMIPIAKEQWSLDDEQIKVLVEKPLSPKKHGYLSLKAIRKLLPLIEAGKSLKDAKKDLGYDDDNQAVDDVYPLLPFPPGTVFTDKDGKDGQQHKGYTNAVNNRLLLPDAGLPITNPVVRKALIEVRELVNAVIKEYGLPTRIRVEMARDTRGSVEQRNEQTKENAKRRKDNEKARDHIKAVLKANGVHREPTGGDLLKYRLWLDCDGRSAYSGRSIDEKDLYTGAVHVDHIIPWSRCLDDSFSNKVLCFHDENADKGNQTPYEWLGHASDRYQEMLERVQRFTNHQTRFQKLNRFKQKTVPPLESFIQRKLTDTQYIARQVHSYLQCLYPKDKKYVQVGRGQVTSTLRHLWGLNEILWDINNIPENERSAEKNRDDHRHHAIDAVVVALTTPHTLQVLTRRLQFRQEKTRYPAPWEDCSIDQFRQQVRDSVSEINVSHKQTRRVRGPRHQETLYGKTDTEGTYTIRKFIESLTKNQALSIVDERIRKLIMGIVAESEKSWEDISDKDLQKLLKEHGDQLRFPAINPKILPAPIRRVKILVKTEKAFPLIRSNDAQAFVTPGSNHHTEIFEWMEKGKLVRDIINVTRYEAAQRVRQKLPVIIGEHPHPEARLVMALHNNDTVLLRYQGGEPELCRVQKQRIKYGKRRNSPDLYFRPLFCANINNDKTTRAVTSLSLDKFHAILAYVDILGRVHLSKDKFHDPTNDRDQQL